MEPFKGVGLLYICSSLLQLYYCSCDLSGRDVSVC